MTPEARRDRAAILRRDGVAPASGRVLAAFRFFALPAAFACAFLGLSPSWGEVGGEISLGKLLLWNFSPARLRADADAVQTSQPVRSP